MKQAQHNIVHVSHRSGSTRNSSAILRKRTTKKLIRSLTDAEFAAGAAEKKPPETIMFVRRKVKLMFTQMDGYRILNIIGY